MAVVRATNECTASSGYQGQLCACADCPHVECYSSCHKCNGPIAGCPGLQSVRVRIGEDLSRFGP